MLKRQSMTLSRRSCLLGEPLALYVKEGWCLASALSPPSLMNQGWSVYGKIIPSTCNSSISMGPAEGKRGNTLVWKSECTERAAWQSSHSHLSQSKMKIYQGIIIHTQAPWHIHKSSKLIGLNCLEHFSLWTPKPSFLSSHKRVGFMSLLK